MATAEEWIAQYEAARARMLPVGVSSPQQVAGKSGLEMFEAMLRGELPPPPISRALGFFIVEAEAGRVLFQGMPCFDYYNPMGAVHGGWSATLLDSCMACAVHSLVPADKSSTTVELKVNFLRPVLEGCGPLRAEGKVIQVGGRIATAEGRIYDVDGKLYAHGTTTCLVFPLS